MDGKIIINEKDYIDPRVWNEWDNVCSKLKKYFEEQKQKELEKNKHKKPRYRDSHSAVY